MLETLAISDSELVSIVQPTANLRQVLLLMVGKAPNNMALVI